MTQPKVLDLNPVLRVRRQSGCPHEVVVVDEALAHLACEACEKEINPYWWIQRLAAEWSATCDRIDKHEDEMREQHERNIAMMNHRAAQLAAEIDTLEAKKRQLMHERVGDQALGQQVKRWRKPK